MSMLDVVSLTRRVPRERGNVSRADSGHRPRVGRFDGLARLWAPRRMEYVNDVDRERVDTMGNCTFCQLPVVGNRESLIVHRSRRAYVVLNRYPYNNGHLMVVPKQHLGDYTALTAEDSTEIFELTRTAIQVLRDALGAEGFNVGWNLGSAAGASIAEHLHQHVVPRWEGDTNFMPVLGRTKVLPQTLEETWSLLAHHWTNLEARSTA